MEASINYNKKSLWIIRDVFRTQRNIDDGAFCKNSWLHSTVDYFCKTLHIRFSQGYESASDKAKQNPGALPLIAQKLGLQSLQIFSTFKFNFIFTLPGGETLLIKIQYTCLWFQIDSPMPLNTYDINQPLFTCSNSSQQLQTNF